MIITTKLEYRGYEEKPWIMNNSRGITRLACFIDPDTLTVYKFTISEDYAADFKALDLEPRKEYDVVLSMHAQQQITSDTSFGRDRYVVSSRDFICRFEVKEVISFSNTVLPDAAAPEPKSAEPKVPETKTNGKKAVNNAGVADYNP